MQSEREILVSKRDKIIALVNYTQAGRALIQEKLDAVIQQIADLNFLIPNLAVASEERYSKQADLHEAMADQNRYLRDLNKSVRDRQFDLGECEALIANIDSCISALEARKVELQNA